MLTTTMTTKTTTVNMLKTKRSKLFPCGATDFIVNKNEVAFKHKIVYWPNSSENILHYHFKVRSY
jgi:hypothetical protein